MFYVVKGQNSGNRLSLAAAQDLGLITLHLNHVTTKDDNLDKILGKHTQVFHGLGKLKGETVKLNIYKDQIRKAQPQRRIPYHIHKKVEDALKALEKEDVIERVPENEATPWVSTIVVVPKKDWGLNRGKCTFLEDKLEFFGQIFSKEGTRPDPKRVNDLLNAAQPSSVTEVRSLLATLASAPCLSYFAKDKETLVIVDASPVGISAILSQQEPGTNDPKIVEYASRSPTDKETRYSQTEKEALAIVWSVEHFHLFLYSSQFTLVTDHKPVQVIYTEVEKRKLQQNRALDPSSSAILV
ncbi:Hypothetical predicted protein [Paramuricea clavata]|uniref:Reverse transcriptase RNase H-like domain-containing protein n=1 Tax=Paramuricea clavata TaxID=317549 RepID=A0A7D9IA22_PARCT|nr:Hypothetical predicted protein [Paramuricea clavata]